MIFLELTYQHDYIGCNNGANTGTDCTNTNSLVPSEKHHKIMTKKWSSEVNNLYNKTHDGQFCSSKTGSFNMSPNILVNQYSRWFKTKKRKETCCSTRFTLRNEIKPLLAIFLFEDDTNNCLNSRVVI